MGNPGDDAEPAERDHAATAWDSCVLMDTGKSKTYHLKDYLYPEMKKAGLTDKIGIFIWDHNKSVL